MDATSNQALSAFDSEIRIKFRLFNALFTSLPFQKVEDTGILLNLLGNNCETELREGSSPVDIIDRFFSKHTALQSVNDRIDLLFRFIQYIERQVVLFDALEDAAFPRVNDMNGIGSIKQLEVDTYKNDKARELTDILRNFAIRLVLTAHPTQFYPGPVLGIINDLSVAFEKSDTTLVNSYLEQLGKTPFLQKQKPTPYDEAVSLIWYLENVFYHAIGEIAAALTSYFPDVDLSANPVINMGFWPGGDRDGNPFVTSEITLQVARALRHSIMLCYFRDIRRMKRRLTFTGISPLVLDLERLLQHNLASDAGTPFLDRGVLLDKLNEIRRLIIDRHDGLFVHLVDDLIRKIQCFGMYFATLDIRQESDVHTAVFEQLAQQGHLPVASYLSLSEQERIRLLGTIHADLSPEILSDAVHIDAMRSTRAVRDMQRLNGEEGCNRYIISQCHSASNALEVFALFRINGWTEDDLTIDIVPLFETIDDLGYAAEVMETLYKDPVYRSHLRRRYDCQTIMLGFSDGTKDGGYLMANWSIYKAKEELTRISRAYGINVAFFDGRGGPPSRGGGKTNKFYASMGDNISNEEIQLTIQGQTISSNFGTVNSARFNIEQLLNAGLNNKLFSRKSGTLTPREESLLNELASAGLESYRALRDHPVLVDYLLHASPLRFYNETNIGSRPAKRGQSSGLQLRDLRAIPFAGSWSQIKQNVTGFYGVGTAFRKIDEAGRLDEVKALYNRSLFFKTLMDNCEMAMVKSYLPLTAYLGDHEEFGVIWHMIRDEFELTHHYLRLISGHQNLMDAYPVDQLSVAMREKVVLPLVTIQQYGLHQLRDIESREGLPDLKEKYEKLVMRCSFGIINAGRNSA